MQKTGLVTAGNSTYLQAIKEIAARQQNVLRTKAMASLDTTRTATGTPAAGIMTLISRGFGIVADWNDARVTRKSLSRLSARELDDIGLSFADIDMIATRGRR